MFRIKASDMPKMKSRWEIVIKLASRLPVASNPVRDELARAGIGEASSPLPSSSADGRTGDCWPTFDAQEEQAWFL